MYDTEILQLRYHNIEFLRQYHQKKSIAITIDIIKIIVHPYKQLTKFYGNCSRSRKHAKSIK